MGNAINRTQLLRGDFFGRSRPIRPPWSLPENEFVERCTRCGDCISDCPQHILDKGRGGFPQVDFSRGECLFCGECVQTCTPGVLAGWSPQGEGPAPWSVRARIDDRCLALQGVECRSCGDQCDTAAIRFRLVVGGMARPMLEPAACNGCGACYSVCPVQAVELGESSSV
ncbi:MAG: ferredoxin-type protein NapF [Pseudomonadota bacterium]|nr:ferredoxin-type protein NapF [Pseudomonadota bacterium]